MVTIPFVQFYYVSSVHPSYVPCQQVLLLMMELFRIRDFNFPGNRPGITKSCNLMPEATFLSWNLLLKKEPKTLIIFNLVTSGQKCYISPILNLQ